jgi:hypothetical protein
MTADETAILARKAAAANALTDEAYYRDSAYWARRQAENSTDRSIKMALLQISHTYERLCVLTELRRQMLSN